MQLDFLHVFFITLAVVMFIALMCVIARAARREAHLSAQLNELMKATRQAQNISAALTNAGHDIRASLACISTLIEMCHQDAAPMPKLVNNLAQMGDCTNDLLVLLNSVLDASKIVAGKMELKEDEFDLAKLLEDVVDMFHPVAMKKDVDVVLDLFDGSILKHSIVKGDPIKLKQIFNNLLSNAVKFTSQGHITVRAWTEEPNPGDETINEAAMRFMFEVRDMGKGIPKEKRDSVFENYVQVLETSQGQGGTGLGLGIVQSLVRLMGGDVSIVDNENEERGSCFRFDMVLAVSPHKADEGCTGRGIGRHFCAGGLCPEMEDSSSSSLAILLIGNEERRRVSKRFIESLGGIEVCVGEEWIQLPAILTKARRYLGLSPLESSTESDLLNNQSNLEMDDAEVDHEPETIQPVQHRFLLLVIDIGFGPIKELIDAVSEFRSGLQNSSTTGYKVVWLDKPSANYRRVLEEDPDINLLDDIIISRPFHGTRLTEVIKLLPEFGCSMSGNMEIINSNQELVAEEDSISPSSITEEGPGEVKLLKGKKVLIVDDSSVLQWLARQICSSLGAIVDVCDDGGEAGAIVSSLLNEHGKLGSSSDAFPYDFILMDCEMPIVNGYEATQRIRQEEKEHRIRIPIIAVTAHSEGPEVKLALEVGMDSYLQKPLKKERLIAVLQDLNIA